MSGYTVATHLLDTTVYSQPLRPLPLPQVMERWAAVGDANVVTSVIAEAEVRYGLRLKQSKQLNAAYDRLLRGRLQVLPVDAAVGDVFASLKAERRLRGQPLPDLDLLIAATAAHHGLIVATLNPRHFLGLTAVKVEDWAQPL